MDLDWSLNSYLGGTTNDCNLLSITCPNSLYYPLLTSFSPSGNYRWTRRYTSSEGMTEINALAHSLHNYKIFAAFRSGSTYTLLAQISS